MIFAFDCCYVDSLYLINTTRYIKVGTQSKVNHNFRLFILKQLLFLRRVGLQFVIKTLGSTTQLVLHCLIKSIFFETIQKQVTLKS